MTILCMKKFTLYWRYFAKCGFGEILGTCLFHWVLDEVVLLWQKLCGSENNMSPVGWT